MIVMPVTNREIYNNALSIIGQSIESTDIADYDERAPYLLASFCCIAKKLDQCIRKSEGLEKQERFSSVYLALENDFPLCEDLSATASLYIAAMLLADENEELSDKIYERYCDSISTLMATSSCSSESIVEKYFFD